MYISGVPLEIVMDRRSKGSSTTWLAQASPNRLPKHNMADAAPAGGGGGGGGGGWSGGGGDDRGE